MPVTASAEASIAPEQQLGSVRAPPICSMKLTSLPAVATPLRLFLSAATEKHCPCRNSGCTLSRAPLGSIAFRGRITMGPFDAEVQDIRQIATRLTAAVEAGNIEQLGQLMTDDIVVIHGHGRVLTGKRAVMEDFIHSLQSFSVRQTVEPEETIVAGEWAFDRAKGHTAISSRNAGGDTKQFNSKTVTILRKESGLGWRVARAIGVIEQQP